MKSKSTPQKGEPLRTTSRKPIENEASEVPQVVVTPKLVFVSEPPDWLVAQVNRRSRTRSSSKRKGGKNAKQ